jgi:SAM-dependent methyltransferase
MNDPGRNYFAENYADYDRQNSPAKLSFYMGILHRWLPRGSLIFELGVGLGSFLEIASREYQCMGCDPNDFAVEQTRRKLSSPDIRLGSYEQIPFEPACQAVIAWDVLEHVEQLDEALSVICRKLPENGILLGVVPVYDGPLGPVVRFLDKDPTHLWKLSRHQWLDRLKQNHFEVIEFGGIIRKLLFRRWYLHLTGPQWLLKACGSAIYFVARRQKPSTHRTGETVQ